MAEETLQVERVSQNLSIAPWSDLPEDLLYLVSNRLHICDYLNFRRVCGTWRTAAKKLSQCQSSPLFMVFPQYTSDRCSYICPLDSVHHRLNIPIIYMHYRCFGSFYGWLFLMPHSGDPEISLFNPFTCARIDLPLWDGLDKHKDIREVVLSSAPTYPNCTIIILGYSRKYFRFCKVGDDEWTKVFVSPAILISAIVFKSKLYLLCPENHFLSGIESASIAANTATQFRLEFVRLPRHLRTEDNVIHLVESGEELLLVTRKSISQDSQVYSNLSVFKLNLSTLSWVEMKKIGNRVLFLGHKYSASFTATELGCRENQIYYYNLFFSSKPFIVKPTLLVFSMEDGSTISYELAMSPFGITPSFL